MTLSIFTPTHDSRWLREAYASIKKQPFDEWVIAYMNGAKPVPFDDPRVKTYDAGVDAPRRVGWAKRFTCAKATGDILVELDHDDLLIGGAVEKIRAAFEAHPEVGFVYSNNIHCNEKYEGVPRFLDSHGWTYRPHRIKGNLLDEIVFFPPTPAAVSRIWYAPDHVRAFRRDVYEKVGGYDESKAILDDLDLMQRMYLETEFLHIDEPLYIYRVTGKNTWMQPELNAQIQSGTMALYDARIEALAERWAGLHGLRKLDLGARFAPKPGYETVDRKGAMVTCDLEERWPFEDGSVGVVRAYDVIEHLRDPIHTMQELHRILAPGGYAFIQVPSTDGRGAFQDPTHVSYWNENSFLYYTDADKNKYIDCPVRFQKMRCYTTGKDAIGVCWTIAHLQKVNPSERSPGELNI